MVKKKEVEEIAKLSRLELTPEEVEKFRKEFSKILDYIEKLKKADLSSLEPADNLKKTRNVTREDKVEVSQGDIRKKLIDLFPDQKESYLKVKSIIKTLGKKKLNKK